MDFECAICKHSDSLCFKPRVLPCCLPCLCYECANRLGFSNRVTKCPYCRETLPPSICDFSENEEIALQIIRLPQNKFCKICGKEAKNACHLCGLLCPSCENHHRQSLKEQDGEHVVIQQEDRKFQHSYNCENHLHVDVDFYCSDCSVYCCAECVFCYHSNHNYDEIHKLANKFRDHLSENAKKQAAISEQMHHSTDSLLVSTNNHNEQKPNIASGSEICSRKSNKLATTENTIEEETEKMICTQDRNRKAFLKLAIKTKNDLALLKSAPQISSILEQLCEKSKPTQCYEDCAFSDLDNAFLSKPNEGDKYDMDLIFKAYPLRAFPRLEYTCRMISSFTANLKKQKYQDSHCLEGMSFRLTENAVHIITAGDPTKKNVRMICKKKGQKLNLKEVPSHTLDRRSKLEVTSLPIILVYFLTPGESLNECKAKIRSLETKIKTEVEKIVVHCADRDEDLAEEKTVVVVEREKNKIRNAISLHLEKSAFEYMRQLQEELRRSNLKRNDPLITELEAIMQLEVGDEGKEMEEIKDQSIPEEIITYLKQYEDIAAFGIWNKEFGIITYNALTEMLKRNISTDIKNLNCKFFETWSIKFLVSKGDISCRFAKQGDVISKDDKEKYKRTKGTLGGFAICKAVSIENLYGLTCQHVIPAISCTVYFENGNLIRPIGECIFSNRSGKSSVCDISIFKVEDELINECEKALFDETERKRKACVYNVRSEDCKNFIIHKKGAVTGWTKGTLACKTLHVKLSFGRQDISDFMVFDGLDGKFAEGGDSGSLVFSHDRSQNQNMLQVIGMVSGGDFSIRNEDGSIDETYNRYTLGFSIKHALELFKSSGSGFELYFYDEVKSSSSEDDTD